MEIHGYNKTTLLDYPGHVACTVFTGYCNFRCPFCQNGDLVLDPSSQPLVSEEEFFGFLKKRKAMLEGVCVTGGEPTMNKDLPDFIRKIKDFGLDVKLDTNGTRPDVLRKLLEENLISYVAMDIKSSRDLYGQAAGIENYDTKLVEESVEILKTGQIPYEFRTTVVKELHNKEVFEKIAEWIKGCDAYFLQAYRDSERVLYEIVPEGKNQFPQGLSGYLPSELKEFAEYLTKLGIPTQVRGVD